MKSTCDLAKLESADALFEKKDVGIGYEVPAIVFEMKYGDPDVIEDKNLGEIEIVLVQYV